MPPATVLLGWSRPPLDSAVDWLASEHGRDLSHLHVALPGARAGRRLTELLAQRLGPTWRPPRITTAGVLTDALLRFPLRPAGRLARTLAWERALAGLERRQLTRIVADPPARDDLAAWTRLAGEVRALFGEIAAEGLDFRSVAEGPARAAAVGERARWEALAVAQERTRRILAEQDLLDPHLGRLQAIEAGRIDPPDARVVLIGVVEIHGLLRELLERLEHVTALVFAPQELAAGFDPYGVLVPGFWRDRDVSLHTDQWHVADQPADQAACVERAIAGWEGRYSAEEITIGVADSEVVPYLQRRFAAHGVLARDAEGIAIERTRPARLLAALVPFLRRRTYRELAALVRHPDLESRLRRKEPLRSRSPAEILDRYHNRHLPGAITGAWLGDPEDEHEAPRLERLQALSEGLAEVLGELETAERRPVARWAGAIRAALGRVYGGWELDREQSEEQRVLAGALAAIGEGLATLEQTPAALGAQAVAADALELLLGELRGRGIAPRPARSAEPAVELLGWLELALDDAPALAVTGFNEGRVPKSVHGDAWLPDHVRTTLGLPDNERRLARDAYLLEVLAHAREELVVVSGRRTVDGDPILPSRLVFHRPRGEIVERVRHAVPEAGGRRTAERVAEGATWTPPRREGAPGLPERWRVTSFKDYLTSPYLFYLRHVLRAESRDDRAREIQPREFGTLAHRVLEDFGRSELRDSTDVDAIAEHLRDRLAARVAALFGEDTLPAVRLQVAQLSWRLGHFARVQAERARAGWRIQEVEWPPRTETFPFPVDGEEIALSGSMDRIDHHPEHGFAILDYKTGEKQEGPRKTHLRRGEWIDLQLPLYALIAGDKVGEALPTLGYVTLGRKPEEIAFRPTEPPWTRADLEDAWERARQVVRAVRRGELFEVGDHRPWDPIERAVCGVGLVGGEGEA